MGRGEPSVSEGSAFIGQFNMQKPEFKAQEVRGGKKKKAQIVSNENQPLSLKLRSLGLGDGFSCCFLIHWLETYLFKVVL